MPSAIQDYSGKISHRRKIIKLLLSCLWLLCTLLVPVSLFADGIGGRVELSYSHVNTETEDAAGFSTNTKSDNFLHSYHLNFQRALYPNLKFLAGGIFEQSISRGEDEDEESRSTVTTKSGTLDLRLGTHFISSGIGYSRREEKTSVDDIPSMTDVRESYSANLGLRPEGLPALDTILLRTYTYDKERVSQDSVNDSFSLGLRYEPYKNLDLRYQGTLIDLKEKLRDLEVVQVVHSSRATYSRQLGDRISVYTTYNHTRQETKTDAAGTGEVLLQLFPFSGLSVISDTPSLVTLDQNPTLIDGNVTASGGMNIGKNPSIAGDTVFRHMGLDFVNASEVNTIYLWVDRDLPNVVSNAFSWDIYTSPDNQNWTLFQTVSSASFGIFEDRFEIRFSNVTTRFIKVVTRPLASGVIVPPGTDVSNIFITEIQAFLTKSAEDTTSKTAQTSQVYDLNVKWRILDRPTLLYDFYYGGFVSQPSDRSRHILSNALNLSHRFNKVFTASARYAREDNKETTDKSSADVYSMSITAKPLPALLHSLVVSGRFEQAEEGSRDSQSVFLNNGAELYKGVNISLSGGLSVANSETEQRSVSTIINSGATVLPRPEVTINLNYSQTNTKQTGGGVPDSSAYTRRGDFNIAYSPFITLYLFASFGMSAANDTETAFLQNYALTWSPLQDGDLQFNFSFNESLQAEDNAENRTITPSLRWYISRRAYLDVAYSLMTSKSQTQRSDSKTFNSTLNVVL